MADAQHLSHIIGLGRGRLSETTLASPLLHNLSTSLHTPHGETST